SRSTHLPAYAQLLLHSHLAFEPELRATVGSLPLRPGDRILDLACGDGTYSRWLAECLGAGGGVLALDRSPAFLELARKAMPPHFLGHRVGLVQADIDRLPLRDGSFDLVWCAQSLYSLPDPVEALRRMARAARPGGIVAVLENDEFHHVL